MRPAILAILLALLVPAKLLAEGVPGHAPYAAWDGRAIKALSAAQIEDLRHGRGMGMALPAELNGYPGPLHVLELAAQLELTAAQRVEAQRLFDAMQADAVALGEQVIAGEAALDRLFATGTASDAAVIAAALELGRLQGMLRGHHLRYHVAMREVLSPHQRQRYGQLRGYADGAHGHGEHGGTGHAR